MEWIIGLVLAAVLFFVWHGFRTRCPACGVMALHPRGAAREGASGCLDSLDEAGSSFGSEVSKPGYTNARFRCKSCAHQFSRHVAIEWLTIANRLGEECALEEYKKIQYRKESNVHYG